MQRSDENSEELETYMYDSHTEYILGNPWSDDPPDYEDDNVDLSSDWDNLVGNDYEDDEDDE